MSLLKTLVLPPGSLVVLALIALLLRRRYPRLAPGVLAVCLVGIYALSTPVLSTLALSALQPDYADPRGRRDVQAIVVLGGGTVRQAPEYGGVDDVNALTLVRVRYAAKLQRETGLPLLVSGGTVPPGVRSEAEQMQGLLTKEFGVPVRWTELRSVDTFTNATESARILKAAGVDRIFLVTHAWHVPRARLAFEHAGLEVVPAPTAFVRPDFPEPGDILPRASALVNSYYFFHEVVGYAVYTLRARI